MPLQGLDNTVTATARAPHRRVLLIEDNEADAHLAKIVHDQVKHCAWLDIVYSGPDAFEYLRGEGKYSDRTRPDVVLMDMTLPVKSGLDLIADIRAVPGCACIPIVMVSGTENPAALREAYERGANCVIRKSSTWEEYFRKLESCYEFWCSVAELPK